jgi:uncharacterized protein (TIGR01777 family)
MTVFELTSSIPCSADELFAYHARRGALTRLSPPFEKSRNAVEVETLKDGAVATVELDTPLGWRNWRAVHSDVRPGGGFVDVQAEGPFKSWRHEHIFTPGPDAASCTLTDRITYESPLGGGPIVSKKLARVFAWRHATTRMDIELFRALPSPTPLTVAITGSSGLVGRELASLLRVAGHEVIGLVRGKTWNVDSGEVRLPDRDKKIDVLVHLAGEPIAEGRLDEAHRIRVRASRVDVTRSLARKLNASTFISASAVGYYGDRGDEVLTEESARGKGFLADLCADWEAAAHEARGRVATLRIGVVLSPAGGALSQMLPPFRAGLGATLGAGTQWMPLLGVDDVAAALFRAVVDTRVSGAVNGVGPEPLTNRDFTKLLGRVLGRPAIARVPKVAASVLFGKGVADEALYVSQRAVPAKLQAWGHTFRHATTEQALRHVLGR